MKTRLKNYAAYIVAAVLLCAASAGYYTTDYLGKIVEHSRVLRIHEAFATAQIDGETGNIVIDQKYADVFSGMTVSITMMDHDTRFVVEPGSTVIAGTMPSGFTETGTTGMVFVYRPGGNRETTPRSIMFPICVTRNDSGSAFGGTYRLWIGAQDGIALTD